MKRQHVVAQRRHASPESPLKATHLPSATLGNTRERSHVSPFLLMDEAGAYLRFVNPRRGEKALKFLRSHGVSLQRRGRTYLVRQDAIDLLLDTGKGSLDVLAEQHAQLNQRSAAGRPR